MSEGSAEYVERFARQRIKVAGVELDVNIIGEGSELTIGVDLSDDMDRVSAQLAYWGAIAAEAKAELTQVDSWYRRFRATYASGVLSEDPKAAEWKVRNAIESTDGFVQHKQAIALAERNLALAEAMQRAFDKKANQLQSRGARTRAELNAQGLNTPAEPREPRGWNLSGRGSDSDDETISPVDAVRKPSQAEKIRRMEEINARASRGKKKKKRGKA